MNSFAANITLATMLWSIPSAAQSTSADGAYSLRARWESIAESVIVKISVPPSGRLKLIVETETDQSMIENSFLAALARTGVEVTMGNEQSSGGAPLLRISAIVSRATPTLETSCDARWENGDGTVRFLGRFRVSNGSASSESGASGETVLERIFEPLVVIAGAIMVVYLFFTVRS